MGEIRYDKHGQLRLIARAENYVMVRRPRATPMVLPETEWAMLPCAPQDSDRKFWQASRNGVHYG